MEVGEENNYYLKIHGERIIISKEIRLMICREKNHMHYLMRKNHYCSEPDFRKCTGLCSHCPAYSQNLCFSDDLSLEEKSKESLSDLCSYESAEETYIKKEIWITALQIADSLEIQGADIIKLRFIRCLTYREIALLLGIGTMTAQNRLARILAAFRNQAEVFL